MSREHGDESPTTTDSQILSSSSSSSVDHNKTDTNMITSRESTPPMDQSAPEPDTNTPVKQASQSTPSKPGHLRTLSIPKNSPGHKPVTSPSAPSALGGETTPATHAAKRGLNLGLNIFGAPGARPRSASKRMVSTDTSGGLSTHPAAQPAITTITADAKSPIRNISPEKESRNSTIPSTPNRETFGIGDMSISEGGNDNAQSDVPKTPDAGHSSTFIADDQTPTPVTPKAKNTDYNSSDDILSEQLRMLASKELEILEVREHIKILEKRKDELELDLHTLKVNIQRSFMQEVNHPPVRHTVKSPLHISKKSLNKISLGTSVPDPLLDYQYNSNSQDASPEQSKADPSQENKSSWGNSLFSKPLNFIQQVDNLIQQEIDKLQGGIEEMSAAHSDVARNDSNESFDQIDAKEIHDPIKNMAQSGSSHDMIDTMSNHLWAFVKEVRSGLKANEGNAAVENNSQYDPSTSPQKSRQRIPSFSGRQHHGHYSHKSKRKSQLMDKQDESYANVDATGEEASPILIDMSDDQSVPGTVKNVEMKEFSKPAYDGKKDE